MRIPLYFMLTVASLATAFPMTADSSAASQRQQYTIYVDNNGVMRRSDTNAEVSYYGTNYTLPFAHAFRAMPMVGADRKQTIDLDVQHLKRLGLNGFRLHLWDAELADAQGNLLENEHLDLLDYMIMQLEKEGIDIILTAQTNFGNGYPEKNFDTGAFTYDFEKCDIHENPKAQKIQENYLRQLAAHVNPYTGMSYGKDHAIIAVEINNEPCHSDTPREVTRYINRMEKALRSGGFDRIVLYNVSHNPQVTAAYYDAKIEGTTYQWYPDGLVAGHLRRGNFLPYVDNYRIPWKNNIKNYGRMARLVYEYDPGDVLCTYLYPAVTRTFRKEGFQWATQFAYDPTPIAAFNTEYQTHFLNLLYTPGKALGMMQAAEVMRTIPRGSDYGTFPKDTVFGDFRVSYAEDLSLYNSKDKYYYSNNTTATPQSVKELRHIAGSGSSPVVSYPGSGAYFLDRVGDTRVWRLEVMPDVAIFRDPFEKTSLRKPLASLYYSSHPMKVRLPELGDNFFWQMMTDADGCMPLAGPMSATDATLTVTPGIYLLSPTYEELDNIKDLPEDDIENLTRYCAPRSATITANGQHPIPSVANSTQEYVATDSEVTISARVFSVEKPAKVSVYPSYVSFWSDTNPIYEMNTANGVDYTVTLPADAVKGQEFSYNIVVEEKDGKQYTYPARTEGNPLGWDIITTEYYTSKVADPAAPFVLYSPKATDPDLDVAMIPEAYDYRWNIEDNSPISMRTLNLKADPKAGGLLALREYIGEKTSSPALHLHDKTRLVVAASALPANTEIALTGKNGITYAATLLPYGAGRYYADIASLKVAPTLIIPAPYPTFLQREFTPVAAECPAPDTDALDFVQLNVPTIAGTPVELALQGIWLE